MITREVLARSAAWTTGVLLVVLALPACSAKSSPRPAQGASPAFWEHWSDGNAELSGYRVSISRYGAPRAGTMVLVYVTEEMDRTTLIKNDAGEAPPESTEVVLKLNHIVDFRTGIYTYHVMTSVFAETGSSGRERFAPVKIAFSAQEWCGHVYHVLKPTAERYTSEIHSYFSSEGDHVETVRTEPFTLYEDALWIQLRELDGPFENGRDWSGYVVPSTWSARKAHEPLRPLPATIRRSDGERDGAPVTRFLLEVGGSSETFEVEKTAPRRIVRWTTSDGDEAVLLRTTRLPYWRLHRPGDEHTFTELGLRLRPGENGES